MHKARTPKTKEDQDLHTIQTFHEATVSIAEILFVLTTHKQYRRNMRLQK